MLKTIAKHLKGNTPLGQQLKSLPSILEYPEYYKLGKTSVRGVFCKYGHEITDFASANFYIESGDCPTCFIMQEKYGQYIHGEGPEMEDL
jgi:hypothetical protein